MARLVGSHGTIPGVSRHVSLWTTSYDLINTPIDRSCLEGLSDCVVWLEEQEVAMV